MMRDVGSSALPGERGRSQDRVMIISSDGHAMPKMADYRGYLPSECFEDFDDFHRLYLQHGIGQRTIDPDALARRSDPETVDQWVTDVVEPGRLEGVHDPYRRLEEIDAEGIAAEVLFPDFGLAFELGSPLLMARLGYSRTPEQAAAGNKAHNRWLVDYCSVAPERSAAMACVTFDEVDAACAEIRWAKEAGFKGVMLPAFDDRAPVFDPRFEPIWSLLEDLEMPLNSHVGTSSTTRRIVPLTEGMPNGIQLPIFMAQAMFFTQQLLLQLIWGGVLERHPNLQVVFTEQGSGWVVSALQGMDYSYEGSYLTREVRDVVRHRPSEYFARQCHLGSSIFSRAEIEERHQIGIEKMSLGMDYPHHEGAWGAGPGTVAYLQATLGVVGVPADEARLLLGQNAAAIWNFDADVLRPTVERIGPSMTTILTRPETDDFPRGDVNKPLALAF